MSSALLAAWLMLLPRAVGAAENDASDKAAPARSNVYFRLAGGLGGYVGPAQQFVPVYNGTFWGGSTVTRTVGGLAIPFEASVGARIGDYLALGAGLYGEGVPVLEDFAPPRALLAFGPMVDVYFSKTSGFHAQAIAGPAEMIADDLTAVWAPGIGGGLGYEWDLAGAWNLGVLARTTALVQETPNFAAGLLVSATLF